MEEKLNHGLTSREYKKLGQFGYSFAMGMAILAGIAFWKGFPLPIKAAAIFLSIYHLAFSLLNRQVLKPTYFVINQIGKLIGNTITFIVFSALFYLLLTPIVLLLRAAGNDAIKKNSQSPFWLDIPESANDPKRVERLF